MYDKFIKIDSKYRLTSTNIENKKFKKIPYFIQGGSNFTVEQNIKNMSNL